MDKHKHIRLLLELEFMKRKPKANNTISEFRKFRHKVFYERLYNDRTTFTVLSILNKIVRF